MSTTLLNSMSTSDLCREHRGADAETQATIVAILRSRNANTRAAREILNPQSKRGRD